MKKLILLLLFLLIPSLVHAGAVVVQSKQCYVATTCAFSSNVTAGNTIIVISLGNASQFSVTVSDTLTNTFNQDAYSGTTNGAAIYSAYSASGGADTVTRTTGTDNGLIIAEVSGLVTSSPVDVTDAATTIGTGSSPTSNTFTTNTTDFIISTFIEESSATTGTAARSYTFLQQNAGQYGIGIYLADATAGSLESSFSIVFAASTWTVLTVAYKEIVPPKPTLKCIITNTNQTCSSPEVCGTNADCLSQCVNIPTGYELTSK